VGLQVLQVGDVQQDLFEKATPLTPWDQVVFVGIDFEAAGNLPGKSDAPVQVGVAEMRGGEIGGLFVSFIRPEHEVAWSASRVHGITRETVVGAPSMGALWRELSGRLRGRVVVAHGASTEKRHLRAFPLHGFGPWVDTLVLARRALPGLDSHRLGDLVTDLGLADEVEGACPGRYWHDALFDAVAALVLLRYLLRIPGNNGAAVEHLVAGWFHRRQ